MPRVRGRLSTVVVLALCLVAVSCDDDAGGHGPSADPSSSAATAGADPSTGFEPPPGHRWFGQGRVVVAVPETWRSVEAQMCQPFRTRTVVYVDPTTMGFGCPYTPGPRRTPSYVSVQPHETTQADRDARRLTHIGDLEALTWNHPHSRYGQSAGILVPELELGFFISTPRPGLARRIIASATEVPDDYRVVPPPQASRAPGFDAMMGDLRAAGLRPTYVESTHRLGSHGWAGGFLRTEPPLGTPVPVGSGVTAYFSAGRLRSWISPASLRERGWRLRLPTTFTPPVSRQDALDSLGYPRGRHVAFLRTLVRSGHHRLVWVVVDHPRYASPGRLVWVTVVDARSAKVVARSTLRA